MGLSVSMVMGRRLWRIGDGSVRELVMGLCLPRIGDGSMLVENW